MEAAAPQEGRIGHRGPRSTLIVAAISLVLVGAVIASDDVGYNYGYSKGYNNGLGNGLTSPVGCSNPTMSTQSGLMVLLMQPGSTGFVCIVYTWGSQFSQQVQSIQQALQGVGGVWSIPDLLNHSATGGFSPAQGINIAIRSVTTTQDNETVVYSIGTSGNSTGVYTWWAPGMCPGYPLVIGMNITSAQPWLHDYYSGTFSCPAIFFGGTIHGALGVSIEYAQVL